MRNKGIYSDEQKKSEGYWEDASVVEGNLSRFKKFIDKCMVAKEEVSICFLGGSITWGGNATDPDSLSYPHLVFDWLQKRYPNTRFNFFKRGIPGTGSVIATERLERDILSVDPDFIVVEFSVNDGDNELDKEAYESLIRALLVHPNAPAVMHLANVNADGESSEAMHAQICNRYDVPLVSLKPALAALGGDWMPDKVHPNDEGHQILANTVTMKIADVAANCDMIPEEICFDLPKPLTNAGFTDCIGMDMRKLNIIDLGDWEVMPNGSIECKKPEGKPIKISIDCSYFMAKYERAETHDSTVKISVDGTPTTEICNKGPYYNCVREFCMEPVPAHHEVEILMTQGNYFNFGQAYLANFVK